MAKRYKINSKASKKSFTRGANRIHKKNGMGVMRGGIRL